MDEYAESDRLPDYAHGDWIDERIWESTGMEEIFEYAGASENHDLENFDEGYYAITSQNDIGCKRLIPLFYDATDENFETVRGVFDSNPGKTQRYTAWNHVYGREEIEQEIENSMEESSMMELPEEHASTIEQNFSPEREINQFNGVEAVVSTIAGIFR